MNDKILLPSLFETGGAAYTPDKPDKKREGVAWWLRAPELPNYRICHPAFMRAPYGMGVL